MPRGKARSSRRSCPFLQPRPARSGPPLRRGGPGRFNIKDVLESAAGEAETSSTHFGIDGGAGFALRIGPIEGFIEGRVQNVYTEAGVVDAKNIRAIPVTFGILF